MTDASMISTSLPYTFITHIPHHWLASSPSRVHKWISAAWASDVAEGVYADSASYPNSLPL